METILASSVLSAICQEVNINLCLITLAGGYLQMLLSHKSICIIEDNSDMSVIPRS